MSLVTSRELFIDPALPVVVDSVTKRRLIQKNLHRHEYLEMLFFRKGSLTNRFGSSEVVMHTGELIVMKPYVRHVIETRKEPIPLLASTYVEPGRAKTTRATASKNISL
tara:strand:+ start:8015 stop:8341 length:327 start_codon:yes stop_codon:yes gene_type:complete